MSFSGLARLRALRPNRNQIAFAILTAVLIAVPLWRVADLTAYPMTGIMWAVSACLVAWIAQDDPWLGLLAGYWGVRAIFSPLALAFEAMFMALVCVVLLCVARLAGPSLRNILLVVAGLQAALAIVQACLGSVANGSVGNSNYLGNLLAMVTPLAPVWMLPLLLGGVVASKSAMAVLAVSAGLAYRWPRQIPAILALIGVGFTWRGFLFESWATRWQVWQIGWWDALQSPLIGHGPSGWLLRVPLQQHAAQVPDGIYAAAHNEYLQAFHAGGILLVALIGLWAWAHRASWRDPMWGGAALALAVSAIGFFPLQTAATAIVAVTVLGAATRRPQCVSSV